MLNDMPSEICALLVGGPLDGTEVQVRGDNPPAVLDFPTAPAINWDRPTDEEVKPGRLSYRLATPMGPSGPGASVAARYELSERS